MDRNKIPSPDEEDDYQFQLGLALSQSELEAASHSSGYNQRPATLMKTKEEEQLEIEMAMAISLSEAESRRKQEAAIGLGYRSISTSTGASYLHNDVDPGLARYLDRGYWEQKSLELNSPDSNQSSYGWRISDSPNAYQLPPPKTFNTIKEEENIYASVVNRRSLSALNSQNNFAVHERQDSELLKRTLSCEATSSTSARRNYSILQPTAHIMTSSYEKIEHCITPNQMKELTQPLQIQTNTAAASQNSKPTNAVPLASYQPPSTSDISNCLLRLKKVSLTDKNKTKHNGNKTFQPSQIKYAPVFHGAGRDSKNNSGVEMNNNSIQDRFSDSKSKNSSSAANRPLTKPVIPIKPKPVVPPKTFKVKPFVNKINTLPSKIIRKSLKNDEENLPLPPPPEDLLSPGYEDLNYPIESDIELPPPPPPDELDTFSNSISTSIGIKCDAQLKALNGPESHFLFSKLPNTNQNVKPNTNKSFETDKESCNSNLNQNYPYYVTEKGQYSPSLQNSVPSTEFIQAPNSNSEYNCFVANPNIPKPPPLPPPLPRPEETFENTASKSNNIDTPGNQMIFGEDFGKMIIGAKGNLKKVEVGNGQRKSTHDPDLVSVLAKRFLSVNDRQNSLDRDHSSDDDESEWEE